MKILFIIISAIVIAALIVGFGYLTYLQWKSKIWIFSPKNKKY